MSKAREVQGISNIQGKRDMLYLICHLYRLNAIKWCQDLENKHYPVDTDLNEEFHVFMVNHADSPYFVVGIPKKDYTLADQLANKYNFKLVSGKPKIVKGDANEEHEPFPLLCAGDSVFTLEYQSYDHLPKQDYHQQLVQQLK